MIEPIYGKTYLPRKFKVVVAVPPSNDVDVFAHDLGYIAILGDDGEVEGYNVTVGGGMGMTHGQPETYPRTADVHGFLRAGSACRRCRKRWSPCSATGATASNRAHARLKYTIEDRGLDAFRAEVERRSGVKFADAKAFHLQFDRRPLWLDGRRGRQRPSDFVRAERPHARYPRRAAMDDGPAPRSPRCMTAISASPPTRTSSSPTWRRTSAGTSKSWSPSTHAHADASNLRRNAMACVALPTCGLALAESERYLPDLITDLEERLASHGLAQDEIVIRMTGCPNGCARPYLAEIGLVGKGPGRYNLYLGAAFDGSRLSKLYAEDLDHKAIVEALDRIFAAYAAERAPGEHFGDFVIRAGFVAATGNGRDFHANAGPQRAV